MMFDIFGGLLLAFWFLLIGWNVFTIGYECGEKAERTKREEEIKNQLN
jgi:hypothetical protein